MIIGLENRRLPRPNRDIAPNRLIRWRVAHPAPTGEKIVLPQPKGPVRAKKFTFPRLATGIRSEQIAKYKLKFREMQQEY